MPTRLILTPMRARLTILLALLGVLVSACSVGTITAAPDDARPSVALEQSDVEPPRSALSEVIDEALPSVVNVRVTSLDVGALGAQTVEGQGSGVVIDRNGIILTNNHVIREAVKVEVVFADGRDKMEGEVIGRVPEKDLAVVRVEADDLDPIELGRSSELELGDSVAALGFPLGLVGGPTVTAGIVAGKERTITVQDLRLESLLQTDAAINPGNSGGALIDRAGRLVGINTAAASASAAENIGFAISIDSALPVVEEILSEPPEKRAWLGVIIRPVDSPDIATQLRLDAETRGALIVETVAGGPAAEGGLEAGDVITAIDDDQIESAEDLTRTLAGLDPGNEVVIRVVTSDGARTEEVELAQRPVSLPEPEG